MFLLFKKRDFSEYLSDTFDFLKITWRHFFKNYFIICGGFLLILCVLSYFIFNVYMSFIFSSSSGGKFDPEQIFGGNLVLFGIVFILFFIALFVISILSYLYPVIYLRLYEENGNTDFSTSTIIEHVKMNVWRSVKFSLKMIIVTFTIGIPIMILLVLLCFTIIGIPFTFIGFFALMAIVNLAYYIHINDKSVGLRNALKTSYTHVKKNFWPIVGSNFIILLVIQMISSVITMIPMFITIGAMATTLSNSNELNDFSSTGAIFSGIMIVSYLVTFIMQNFSLINNGLIYYSMLELNESHHIKSEIDLIGTESE